VGLRCAQCITNQRLLAQHWLALFEAGQQLLLVRGARRREQHRVNVVGIDRVERIRGHPGAGDRSRNFCGLLRQIVVDDGDSCAADSARDAGGVVGTHHADAQHGNTQIWHGL
jgi:hypothetical protein